MDHGSLNTKISQKINGAAADLAPATTGAATSWRDTLRIHPACAMFPLLPPDELRALGEDIRANGMTSHIALWRADPKAQLQMLDGRSRLDAIELVTGCPVEIGVPSLMAGDFLATGKVTVLEGSVDPYAYVISANIYRRHLDAEQKRDLIAKVLKATPEKSDRQIAETVKASPTTVGTVRAKMEAKGEVSKLDTRTDRKGIEQPARKPKRATDSPPPVSDEVLHQRAAAAERVRELLGKQGFRDHTDDADTTAGKDVSKSPPPTEFGDRPSNHQSGDDDGSASSGELGRLRVRIEELEAAKRQREIKITGLESEIEELKTALQAPKPDLITTEALAALTLPKFLAIMPAEWRPELMRRARTLQQRGATSVDAVPSTQRRGGASRAHP